MNASKYKYKRIKHKSFNGIHDSKILNRIAKDKRDGIFETVKYKYKTNSNKKKEYISRKTNVLCGFVQAFLRKTGLFWFIMSL